MLPWCVSWKVSRAERILDEFATSILVDVSIRTSIVLIKNVGCDSLLQVIAAAFIEVGRVRKKKQMDVCMF